MVNLIDASTAELLRLHGAILTELRRREVVRSANGPAGDYAELLFSKAFDWRLEGGSTSGHDAVDLEGVRYQIKCRRLTPQNKSRQLSFIRNLPDRPFDILAGVLFDEHFRVQKAALIPVELIQANASYVAHVNAWRLLLRDVVWTWPGVRDVTTELRAAEAAL
ncbi:hypothetical protein [Brevundimonas sp.]|uniref:hypothetical protein n=1 Tax=Brevundimonas sp. TaxID=1871086 RepID=UPI0028982FB3|nr:hypothetical protein [Brevundimonas sp.]